MAQVGAKAIGCAPRACPSRQAAEQGARVVEKAWRRRRAGRGVGRCRQHRSIAPVMPQRAAGTRNPSRQATRARAFPRACTGEREDAGTGRRGHEPTGVTAECNRVQSLPVGRNHRQDTSMANPGCRQIRSSADDRGYRSSALRAQVSGMTYLAGAGFRCPHCAQVRCSREE